ncbi:membrane protein insertase YidC [Tropicimonas isoalkanivorans]|uniref:Membrane protein insertase YidC n=1 Tax=Tropicimonas isoalkanivorans TaxID=441112 RepID=A0A1I1QSQ7_9RHOB|nr:membrane protein insertase YidC [Tropicimonas isoalkanivorans]SFD25065.1 protein translocase subunit yidC [Tropicimonas isoalkanivorans]
MDDQNKNLILATALSFLVILGWFLLFPPEQPPVNEPQPAVTEAQTGEATTVTPPQTADSETAAAANAPAPMEDAPRIAVETPRLTGSISLAGGRIDDLLLNDYRETLDADSPNVRLLDPVGGDGSYYSLFGWAAGGGLEASDVPGTETLWSVESGETLTPESPVILRWDSPSGLIFRRELAVDANYMFTVTQSVENPTDATVRAAPYGIIARHGLPDTRSFFILHEGVVAMADGNLIEKKYGDFEDLETDPALGVPAETEEVAENGWIGFTDKYWMTTLIPQSGTPFKQTMLFQPSAGIYQTQTVYATAEIAPGQTLTQSSRLFAGAKEWETIRDYQDEDGVYRFVDSIDWGWFFFLTKPIFRVLHFLNNLIGNMGWSIIALTLIIKALLFPLAYKSYSSMAKMKELQPEMEKLKERAGDDRMKLQKEMMELYKKEKVNPASGCLPILMQIPIFFSLYKVIFVTIELRHAPWIGWIRDLSAPDPSSILNLFGLLPWSVPELGALQIISLGVLPILLGISMWLQQKLNPAPADPTQQMIFAWMPWVFMFMLGNFASGLVLYWITNNTITFTQQYLIMRSHGYKPDVFGNILSTFRRKKPDAK